MKRLFISAVCLVPSLLVAQTGTAQGAANASSSARVPSTTPAQGSTQASAQGRAAIAAHVPAHFSATARARLEAMYSEAERENLPPEPIAKRVAEGEAKGASEASIVAAASKVHANLQASQQAMIAAGRAHPSGEECERGAMLMARGVTSAQIETVARHAPADRSLVVAFDVLGRLNDQGVPVTQAMSRVEAKLDARASDAVLISLAGSQSAGASAAAGGSAGTTASGTSAGASAGVGVGVGATTRGSAAGTAATLGAGVTGTVTGVVKKP